MPVRAIVCHAYGPPHEALRLVDLDPPDVGDDQVLVRVRAASVNPADWHIIRGDPYVARLQIGLRRPKYTRPGCDIAGEVTAVGASVSCFRPGDEVFGTSFMRGFGAFAEAVAVDADLLRRKPANLSFEQAAAVPLAALTALQGLRDHGRVERGHEVLVVGASGGVGTFAVQIAKALGATVTGVCSTRNVTLVQSLGAEHVVDYTAEDWTAGDRRYDVVLQVAGAASVSACRRALEPGGTLVQISGDAEGHWIGPIGRMIRGRLLAPVVRERLTICSVTPGAADLLVLRELIEAGSVTPVIDRTYPLDEVADAVAYQEAGHTQGKVVITM